MSISLVSLLTVSPDLANPYSLINSGRYSFTNSKIGLDFPELLRSVLRQVPDEFPGAGVDAQAVIDALEGMAGSGSEPLGRLHALCTLDGR